MTTAFPSSAAMRNDPDRAVLWEQGVKLVLYTCGKNGQGVDVSAGGPSIRVKRLSIS